MELKLQTFWLIKQEKQRYLRSASLSHQIITGGVILRDGQVSIARGLPNSSYANFPSLYSFQ